MFETLKRDIVIIMTIVLIVIIIWELWQKVKQKQFSSIMIDNCDEDISCSDVPVIPVVPCPEIWNLTEDDTFNANAQISGEIFSCTAMQDDKVLTTSGWNLYRFNADGTLDTTFGSSGVLDLTIPGFTQPGTSFTSEPDGFNAIKYQENFIYICGTSSDINASLSRAIVYKVDNTGVIDVTFGTSGYYTDNATFSTEAFDITFQDDGKLLVCGSSGKNQVDDSTTTPVIIRLNTTGTLDTTFGDLGYAAFPGNTHDLGQLRNIFIQSSGRIIAGGTLTNSQGNLYGFGVVGFDQNGNVDSTYGANSGFTLEEMSGIDAYGFSATQDLNENIYVTGYNAFFTNYEAAIVKFDVDGNVDLTWSTNGIFRTIVPGDTYNQPESIIATCDGGLLVTGLCSSTIANAFAFIMKLTSDGNLDPDFGNGGIVTYTSPTLFAQAVEYQTATEKYIYAVGRGPEGDGSFGTIIKFVSPI